MHLLSGIVVVSFGLYLIGLAAVIVAAPAVADRFLNAFASSARTHYTEQALRLLVGGATINFAGAMWFEDAFRLFGWLVIVSTIGLLLIPWQWHHRFASRVMPPMIERKWLLAVGSSALGAFVLYAASRTVIQ
ncbi:MAG: hypothetical protein FJW21_06035 [Acidimicrobiia bacterium]|nr:hypothetical protein [Acidimicrobiia bacterium]